MLFGLLFKAPYNVHADRTGAKMISFDRLEGLQSFVPAGNIIPRVSFSSDKPIPRPLAKKRGVALKNALTVAEQTV